MLSMQGSNLIFSSGTLHAHPQALYSTAMQPGRLQIKVEEDETQCPLGASKKHQCEREQHNLSWP